jgi:hypothetical protein
MDVFIHSIGSAIGSTSALATPTATATFCSVYAALQYLAAKRKPGLKSNKKFIFIKNI